MILIKLFAGIIGLTSGILLILNSLIILIKIFWNAW